MAFISRLSVIVLVPAVMLAGLFLFWPGFTSLFANDNHLVRIELPEPGSSLNLPAVLGPPDASRPLIVIDAGHGGHDPGAGGDGLQEKTLTLDLARTLRDQLLANGGIRVALTRDDDRFLALAERRDIARALGATLFLSIHADSAGEEKDVSGASLYTLSAQASDEAAARLATRENRADRINGMVLDDQNGSVNAILFNLSQRRARDDAGELARLIVREGEGEMVFHPSPRRSAAFAVLKSPDIPSILFEAGYITNPDEARRLASPEGRMQFGEIVARAIRIYFARQAGG
ncbi:putative N-acetylmuramoyl-L-alanine amidase [Caenibius tardaugens NBRC 16725]|uniref:N-acetylmuramoyl-L-alanine amidase n=1 Tax=Caenibius tardaugens NBRC 16725 TaxID=1219035 RepID=U2ZRI3_9SPHN|nr:N-acetylmuramoyl-L-alanine amidase [Caenibius tardaugens NBRC 16725]GAD47974.1 putative N-acetylmuramoyl-L-alanine amidase [Caenibius tardaugens NBRC 16725]